MELFLATTNAGKIKEIQSALKAHFAIFTPKDEKFRGVSAPKVVEDDETYYQHALKKALQFHAVYRLPVLADDSGLELDVLEGKPGVHSAVLGGEKASWADRWEALYGLLRPFPQNEWQARFRAVLCYYDGVKPPVFFQETCEGAIVPTPRGDQGFGYDPIFFSHDVNKTFGEATAAEKARFSHRAKAVQAFLAWSQLDHPRR